VEPLRVIKGDAASPQASGPKVIARICNDLGGRGKGFVVAVPRRWPGPERGCRRWHRGRAGSDFGLGAVQLAGVRPGTRAASMTGQHGVKPGSAGPPVRCNAVERRPGTLAGHAARPGAPVRMPRPAAAPRAASGS